MTRKKSIYVIGGFILAGFLFYYGTAAVFSKQLIPNMKIQYDTKDKAYLDQVQIQTMLQNRSFDGVQEVSISVQGTKVIKDSNNFGEWIRKSRFSKEESEFIQENKDILEYRLRKSDVYVDEKNILKVKPQLQYKKPGTAILKGLYIEIKDRKNDKIQKASLNVPKYHEYESMVLTNYYISDNEAIFVTINERKKGDYELHVYGWQIGSEASLTDKTLYAEPPNSNLATYFSIPKVETEGKQRNHFTYIISVNERIKTQDEKDKKKPLSQAYYILDLKSKQIKSIPLDENENDFLVHASHTTQTENQIIFIGSNKEKSKEIWTIDLAKGEITSKVALNSYKNNNEKGSELIAMKDQRLYILSVEAREVNTNKPLDIGPFIVYERNLKVFDLKTGMLLAKGLIVLEEDSNISELAGRLQDIELKIQ